MLALLYTFSLTKVFPLLLAGIGFGLLITVHELGHFFFCKLFNIGTPVFSIGFGPSLIKKKIGATEFRLSLIPLGGYCAIQGMGDPEAGMVETHEESLDPAFAFETKSFTQKLLVILGGILFNIIFAYSIFIGMHWGTRQELKTELSISYIVPNSAAESHKLTAGTIITGYNDTVFSADKLTAQAELRAFLKTISESPNKELTLTLKQSDGEEETRTITLGTLDATVGSLGVGLDILQTPIPGRFVHNSYIQAVHKGIAITNAYITTTANAITSMFKRRSLDGMAGPLTMFSQTFKSAQLGLRALWEFLGMISITLALMNLIPIGALDGGQLLFILLEGIIRRPLPRRLKEGIVIASWILFFLLIIVLSYKDILRMIS
ncbi:MAG: site-2 protease family protein [bacterium]